MTTLTPGDGAANRVDGAVARCLEERLVLTPDLGGNASTSQVGDEVVRLLGAG